MEEKVHPLCTCPKECDCQNPPPDDWDERNGVYHVSDNCPIHNKHPAPRPREDCPVHGIDSEEVEMNRFDESRQLKLEFI